MQGVTGPIGLPGQKVVIHVLICAFYVNRGQMVKVAFMVLQENLVCVEDKDFLLVICTFHDNYINNFIGTSWSSWY